MTTNNSQTCPRCHGTGRNPEDSLLGWPDKPCFVCHGTGQLTPALVNIGGEMDSNKDSVTTQAPGEIVEPTAEEVLSRPHHPLWDKASAATEDMGKLTPLTPSEILDYIDGCVKRPGGILFKSQRNVIEDYIAILIATHDRARLDAVLEAIGANYPRSIPCDCEWTLDDGYKVHEQDCASMQPGLSKLRTAVKAIFKMEDGR